MHYFHGSGHISFVHNNCIQRLNGYTMATLYIYIYISTGVDQGGGGGWGLKPAPPSLLGFT